MSKLVWDEVGNKIYETGTSKGVLYPQDVSGAYPVGVAWDGLIGVTESPSGAEPTALYANNRKYLELRSAEDLGVTIKSYTYPDEFEECDGSASPVTGVSVGMQQRKPFGLSYQTILGNDTSENDYGYKLHLIYGCKASPSERAYNTVNDSPEAIEFSWEATTTPVSVNYGDLKSTSVLTITSTNVNAAALKKLEDILYGTDELSPRLPLPDEVINLFLSAPTGEESFDKSKSDYGGFGKNEYYYDGELVQAWNGLNCVATGKLKWVTKDKAPKLDSEGYYFAFKLDDYYEGEDITVDNGGRVKTAKDTDWVCKVTKETKRIVVKCGGAVIVMFDLSNVTFEEHDG